VDVGTLHGYREAIRLLSAQPQRTILDGVNRAEFALRATRATVSTFDEPRSKRLREETNKGAENGT
jgi:hypothetical protein